MGNPSLAWTTIGSAGILNQADLAKVTFHQSSIRLGVERATVNLTAAPETITQPVSGTGHQDLISQTVQAVARYNVTAVENLVDVPSSPLIFRYGLKIRFRGHIIVRLMSVNFVSGELSELVVFDKNMPGTNLQVQEVVPTYPSDIMDFTRDAYYVEATLIAPGLVAGHPAEISAIAIITSSTLP